MKTQAKTFVFSLLLLCAACSGWFEYSPYDADVDTENINAAEIAEINRELQSTSDTFKFAVMADIHDYYDEMSEAVSLINELDDIRFVICCGDITSRGLAQEFEWYSAIVKKSKHPFITVIGNHEHRSNGFQIFCKLFGSPNISFTSERYKFILFDNTIWENNNLSPNYEWLIDELADSTRHNIVICHIPPWGDQMFGLNNIVFKEIVTADNTMLCVHGHTHNFYETHYNGIHTLVSEAINDRQFYIVSLTDNSSNIKPISF